MKKFISLSQYPGTTGQYFYTEFFKHYNIDATYEPRASSDVRRDIELAKQENVNGISISMPFKTAVLPILDDKHAYVSLYNSCNTIKIDKNKTTGYNADIAGVEYVYKQIKNINYTLDLIDNNIQNKKDINKNDMTNVVPFERKNV